MSFVTVLNISPHSNSCFLELNRLLASLKKWETNFWQCPGYWYFAVDFPVPSPCFLRGARSCPEHTRTTPSSSIQPQALQSAVSSWPKLPSRIRSAASGTVKEEAAAGCNLWWMLKLLGGQPCGILSGIRQALFGTLWHWASPCSHLLICTCWLVFFKFRLPFFSFPFQLMKIHDSCILSHLWPSCCLLCIPCSIQACC